MMLDLYFGGRISHS